MANSRNALTPVIVSVAFGFLCTWEGVSYTAHHDRIDPPGVLVVCNGLGKNDIKGLKVGDKFTPAMCTDLLSKALPKYDKCIQDNVKVDLPAHRHVALLSYVYNEGCGHFRKTAILRELNAGNVQAACDHFLDHENTTARHIVLQGLINRRRAERALCLRED